MTGSKLTPIAVPEQAALAALAERINAAHAECERAVREGLARAAEVGQLLLQAKTQIPHGGWAEWRQAHCRFSERTAQAYMRVAKQWDRLAKTATGVADLSFRGALALLAEPRQETPTDTPDDPDPTGTPEYVPPAGYLAMGDLGGGDHICIEPSAHPGGPYYYVTVVQDDGEDGGIVDGTIKPVLAEGIAAYLEALVPTPKLAAVRWHAWPHEDPKDYNAWLFADHDAYMQDFVLGGWVAQKVHERAMQMAGLA